MGNIIDDFLKYLEIKHTKYFVNKLFNEHPHKTDMYGLKKMLESYGIQSVGVYKKDKANIFCPSICHVGQNFVIALEIDKDQIKIIEDGRKKTVSLRTFQRLWDGKTLVVTSIENAKEKDYFNNLGVELISKLSWYSLICIPFIFIFVLLFRNSQNNCLPIIPIYILDFIGLLLCWLLLQKKIKGNTIGDKLCSLISENGCDAVLESDSSHILYIYSWSEIGLAYFCSNLILTSFASQFMSGILIINYIAMIYGCWSVWYQAVRIKKWCTLCLSVQIVIWLMGIYNSILLYCNYIIIYNILLSLIVTSLYFVWITVVVHNILKSYIDDSLQASLTQRIKRFQVDKDVLKVKYNKELSCSDVSNVSSVLWGNPHATHVITIVTNPSCHHCADLYNRIKHLLIRNNLKTAIMFVFHSSTSSYDDVCKMLIAAKQQLDTDGALKVFSKWFDNISQDVNFIVQNSGLDIYNKNVHKEYERHKQWISNNSINKTPYVLINNHFLPNLYQVEDIENIDE